MTTGKALHADVTLEAVEAMARRYDNEGMCLGCGNDAYGVEPDAERYTCEACGEPRVYGAEQLLVLGLYHGG